MQGMSENSYVHKFAEIKNATHRQLPGAKSNQGLNQHFVAASVCNKFLSLHLDTQGEFALLARDYHVETSVFGWYNRLQQSCLAALVRPACTRGWTPQPQGTYIYRLEARIAWVYAAWPLLRGLRSAEGPSFFVARFSPTD